MMHGNSNIKKIHGLFFTVLLGIYVTTLQAYDYIDVRTQAEAFCNEMLWATTVLGKETMNGE